MSDSFRTVDDVKTLLESWKGFDSRQRMKFYDSWAETYDQDTEMINYRAPHLMVDFLNANFSGNREEVQVLDVACGSGLVAKLMIELGFKHFAGVDGSKGMLEQAAKTGLYQDLKLALLGTEPLPAQTGCFDVVIIVGALRDGFVPVSVVRELCDAAKPGGYICMSRVDPKSESGNKYKVSMEKELQLMEEEGLWTHVITREMDKYMMDVYNICKDVHDEQYLNGTMYLYRKSLNESLCT
ncbi:methyltransferase-like protein 27 isoform X1 [Sebastes umbrosus]|uniref:methyltransferase-like protein 27 isoform X1 n=1 Tax=Sebastes umbrosus TaxID=72105 RepID=UPI00189C70B4|nr:methyltransferase-like protein 27 isoform X1 [Sebastes umbrosus]